MLFGYVVCVYLFVLPLAGASPVTIPPSSTTPSPGGGGHPSAAAATFAVSVGTLFMSAVTVAVTVSVIAAAAI